MKEIGVQKNRNASPIPTSSDEFLLWWWTVRTFFAAHDTIYTLENLIRNEFLFVSNLKRQPGRVPTLQAVLSSVDCELDRLEYLMARPGGRAAEDEHARGFSMAVYEWRLCEIGCNLMSKGVNVLELVETLMKAEASLLWVMRQATKRLMEPAAQLDAMVGVVRRRNPQRLKAARKLVRHVLRNASRSNMAQIIARVIEPEFGYFGRLLTYHEVAGVKLGDHRRSRASLRRNERIARECLLFEVVDLLKRYRVKGRFQIGAETMNCLLAKQEYRIERDPSTHKSPGEEKLRLQFNREVRSRAAKRKSKQPR